MTPLRPLKSFSLTSTLFVLTLASCSMGIALPMSAADISLESGDRIVFLGDSITQAGAGPGGYVSLVREGLQAAHADLDLEVIGAGISGNRVPDLQKRLDRDVLAKKPDWVVIYIGINDVWHSTSGRGTSEEDYRDGLQDVITRIKDGGAKVLLCTPSVIGEKVDGSNSLDEMLEQYSQISREVAEKNDIPMLDLRKLFIAELKEANPENKANLKILTTDGVHLNDRGNRFVADSMLSAFGVDPKAEREGLLRHIVMIKFKDESKPADIKRVVDAFAALQDKIDEIHDFEMGTNNSPEGLSDGFTHAFVVTFKTEKDREAYLPHEEHQAFVEVLKPHMDKVMVIDFWAK